jgi:uncharacterized protein YheU (UPF0270 family)
MTNQEKEEFIEIPMELVSAEALDSLIEEFILREGTDYGHAETTLDAKKSKVINQLKSKRAKIVFSTLTENTSLVLSH